ncbi:GspH/FimT family pseudopilin [Ramlibacter sp. MAHUQ-53]|uniref:GspH/FimT family pseudopilin n=1 Tax=unclassified Ramlibacter TaxID=2617605 RepID=UPI00363238A1
MRLADRSGGFTMIELMVTLSILGIVVALVAPSFNDSLARTRLKSQASDVVNMLELTRSEALKRNSVTTTIYSSDTGSAWKVDTEWTQPDNSKELRSTVNSSQVRMANPKVVGATIPTTATSLVANFRGIFTGFVSTQGCKDGDSCMQLESSGGKYKLRVGINAVGQVTVCAVGDAFGGYPVC